MAAFNYLAHAVYLYGRRTAWWIQTMTCSRDYGCGVYQCLSDVAGATEEALQLLFRPNRDNSRTLCRG